MSSYDYYIWIRSASDAIAAFLPVIVVAAILIGGLIGWRWWLRSKQSDPKRLGAMEKRLKELESRVTQLENRRSTERGER